MRKSEARILSSAERITDAARVLIGMTRNAEADELAKSTHAELSLNVELTGGGVETWKITVERVSSLYMKLASKNEHA